MAEALAVGGGRLAPAGQRGVFAGYASLFGVADQTGDVVMPGAFAASLARRGPGGIRMLFQHDASQPIGTWLDLREDGRGLFVRGRLSADVQQAEELGLCCRTAPSTGCPSAFAPCWRRAIARRVGGG
jgi:uncharacterized protein